jgi:hypothetical protein
VIYADAGYQGIARRPEMMSKTTEFRVAMRPGKRRALPDTPDGRLQDLIETAKAHVRAKGEHPFRVIKQQFGFQKTRLRGMAKNRCKVNVIAALPICSWRGDSCLRRHERGSGVLGGPIRPSKDTRNLGKRVVEAWWNGWCIKPQANPAIVTSFAC